LRIALLQIESPDDEAIESRRARVEQELLTLDPSVDLVVLPELWGVGYLHFEAYEASAEPLESGPTVALARRAAAALDAHVHIGSVVERARDGVLRNTSALVSPAGDIVHSFSKIHVFGYESIEPELLTPGASLVVADTPLGRIAGTTCYDVRFPGLWQEISDRGAELVTVPAAWPLARVDHWRTLTKARAIEHQIVVVACNAAGAHAGVELGGHSRVVLPTGEIVAEAGTEPGVTYADVDADAVASARAAFPVLADRLAREAYPALASTASSTAAESISETGDAAA